MTKKTDKVKVSLGERSYDIVVGSGLLPQAGGLIKKVISGKRVFVVTDNNIAKAKHVKTLEQSLKAAKIEYKTIILRPGERTKSFIQLGMLLDKLLSFRPARDDTLIALGGGVIGDITGFAASTLLRGIGYVQIPTTLLAMVDSSVGGKTGINTRHGKNLIGSFYQPKLVIADVDLLKTLPKRELLAGYAEVVKYGLISDAKFFARLEKNAMKDQVANIITSCKAKAQIVSEDERESGRRALLNLGHTFGHALEAEIGYSSKLLHGEAVAVGMVMAFQFSNQLRLCSHKDVQRVKGHLKKVGLPTSPLDISKKLKAEKLLEHMRHDKKIKSGKMVFILVKGIGKAFIQKGVNEDKVMKFLKQSLTGDKARK